MRSPSPRITVFEYVVSGKGEILIDGEWREAQAGDFYILAPSEEHKYRASASDPWHKIWINYSSSYMEQFLKAYGVPTGIYRSARAAVCFRDIFDAAESSESASEISLVIAERIHTIVSEASREVRCESHESRLRAAVAEYVYRRLDLDELARELHMSKSSLIRGFRRATGTTPYEYLLLLKIKAAKALLRDTELPLREIAERLAVSDEHYLSAMFYRRTGVRPGAYRRKYRVR